MAQTVSTRCTPCRTSARATCSRTCCSRPRARRSCSARPSTARTAWVRTLERAGVKAAVIHGNKSQGARTRALGDFKAGRVNVLVATDIAARGLDIAQLPLVVNFDLPLVAEDYIHRAGRTGRAGSRDARCRSSRRPTATCCATSSACCRRRWSTSYWKASLRRPRLTRRCPRPGVVIRVAGTAVGPVDPGRARVQASAVRDAVRRGPGVRAPARRSRKVKSRK